MPLHALESGCGAGSAGIMVSSHSDMANALRALSIDAIEAAQSGHPGLPLGAADIVTVLFAKFLKFNPDDPQWPDRDRFILSAGHGSMLLYALLHLTGYEDMSLDDIRRFRQLGSRAAGHPEFGSAQGIEVTTGPLGQGFAMAVGMAIAERHLHAHFGTDLIDHHTYVLVSDGDLMEGISQEAAALAGHLRLGKLVVALDDNGISIDGPLSLTDTIDQVARFSACGWHTQSVDGHDPAALAAAFANALEDGRPSFIACKTIIGYGSPGKQGTCAVHGSPLGEQEALATKHRLGWHHPPFEIPPSVRRAWRDAGARGAAEYRAWKTRLTHRSVHDQREFARRIQGKLPENLDSVFDRFKETLAAAPAHISTRKASEMVIETVDTILPEIIGGSADLTHSNNTRASGMTTFSRDDYSGRFIHYGVREHAMAAAMNGLALHGGIIPYSGTFLVFSDYCRPALRLSALMRQRCIHVMTHDSIGLGEDGPTHQPIEHLASLRAIPNLLTMRPCDAIETAECWQIALHNKTGPAVLALSRQNLPAMRVQHSPCNLSAHGGYIIRQASRSPDVTIIATGSEVHLAVRAAATLETHDIAALVVSMPCQEIFDRQTTEYRDSVIPCNTLRVAVEAALPMGWQRYVGSDGIIVGLEEFGASAPCATLYEHFHITPDRIVSVTLDALKIRNLGHKGTRI